MKKLKFIIIAALVAALLVPGFAFAAENSPTKTVTVTPVSASSVYNGQIKSVKVKVVKKNGDIVFVTDKTPSANAGTYRMYHTVGTTKYYYNYTIKKAANVVTTDVSKKTYYYSKLKKQSYSFHIKTSTLSKGALSYGSSTTKITVSSKGTVTVKKGISKGTYRIAVRSAATKNYNKGVKYISIVVK